jgi:hypothetical protein
MNMAAGDRLQGTFSAQSVDIQGIFGAHSGSTQRTFSEHGRGDWFPPAAQRSNRCKSRLLRLSDLVFHLVVEHRAKRALLADALHAPALRDVRLLLFLRLLRIGSRKR